MFKLVSDRDVSFRNGLGVDDYSISFLRDHNLRSKEFSRW